MEKDTPHKWKPKESWVGQQYLNQTNQILRQTVITDKKDHDIILKGSIQQQDITFVNIYAPNTTTPKYIKQILTDLKREIDSNTIIVEILKPHLHHWIDHLDRKLIRKHQP